jgi:hypothetical protein
MMRPIFACLLLLSAAGCVGSARDPTTNAIALEGTGPAMAEPWTIGDWWDLRVYMDLGPGYREEGSGRVVVASRNDTGYRLLAADRPLSVLDYYFDLFFVGRFDAQRSPLVEGQPVRLFPNGSEPGATWASWFPVPVFGPDRLQPSALNLSAERYDPEIDDGRLRITGLTDAGFLLDLDYSPSTKWFTYVRLTDAATGRMALAVDIDRSGHGFSGTLHDMQGTVLHERIVVTPPCTGPGACNASLANVPPIITANVAQHGSAEMVAYLFSFPVVQVGGGAVEFLYTDPDGIPTRLSHAGAGNVFEGRFFRMPYEQDPAGDWTFQYHIAGTAGAYTGLFGLDDHPVEL